MHFGENQLSRSLIGLSPPIHSSSPSVFNLSGFGPPRRLTVASAWPWIDHFASGLGHATESPYSDSLSLRLPPHGLTSPRITNSQAHSSKGTLSPPAKEAPTVCKQTVSGTISLPSRGYFSPFPHGTCPLSVIWEYLGLSGGPDRFTRDFSGPRATWDTLHAKTWHFGYGVGTLYDPPFNAVRLYQLVTLVTRQNDTESPTTPGHATPAGYHTHPV